MSIIFGERSDKIEKKKEMRKRIKSHGILSVRKNKTNLLDKRVKFFRNLIFLGCVF